MIDFDPTRHFTRAQIRTLLDGIAPAPAHIADVAALTAEPPVPVDVNGAIQAKLRLHYDAPWDLGTGDTKFTGVFAHVQTPDKTVHVPDSYTFSGSAGAAVKLEVVVDYPSTQQDYYVYLTSKSDNYSNPLVLHDAAAPSPNIKVTMPVNPLIGGTLDVLAFRAGTFDQATGAWSAAMKWDPLRTKMLCDWGCLLPGDLTGWGSVSIFIKTAAGEFVQAAAPVTVDGFTQTDAGLVYYGCIAIEGAEIPSTPESWKIIACSYDINGKPNLDLDGNPFGPSVDLMTLGPQAQPITADGKVNLATATGTITIDSISNLGSFSINAFSGNIGIDRITNLGSFNITGFSGNIGIDRIDNLGSFNIASFAGNLPVARIDNLGSVNITTFSGSLPIANISNLGSFNIGSFEGVITNDQLAAGMLDDLTKFSANLRPITKVSALPVLPDAAYPSGTTVLLTSDSTLHTTATGLAGSWTLVSASATVTGKIADADITSISCSKFVGQILAANVSSLNVSSLAGTLSVGQCNSLTVTNFSGNWDCSRLTNVSALNIGSMSGTITISQISNLATFSLGSFAGSIAISQISNLYTASLGSFAGSIAISQISNLSSFSIGSFTGTLTISQISDLGSFSIGSFTGNLVIGQIGDGLITSAKIASLSCSKLTSGTITGTVSMTSPSITGGTITGVSITGATITGTISISSPSISGGTFSGVTITGATVNGTVSISSPSITGGTISGVTITGATINGTISITSPSISGGSVSGSSLSGGSLSITSGSGVVAVNTGSMGLTVTNGSAYGYLNGGSLSVSYGGTASALSYNALSVGGYSVINSSGQWVGRDISCSSYGVTCYSVSAGSGGISTTASFTTGTSVMSYNALSIGGYSVINSSGQFVGNGGVACPNGSVGGLQMAVYYGGWCYGATFTFQDLAGVTHSIRGGIALY